MQRQVEIVRSRLRQAKERGVHEDEDTGGEPHGTEQSLRIRSIVRKNRGKLDSDDLQFEDRADQGSRVHRAARMDRFETRLEPEPGRSPSAEIDEDRDEDTENGAQKNVATDERIAKPAAEQSSQEINV